MAEFKPFEVVTFQAYADNEPIKRVVVKVTIGTIFKPYSLETFYHLGHKLENGGYSVTNVTTGQSIQESKLFNLNEAHYEN